MVTAGQGVLEFRNEQNTLQTFPLGSATVLIGRARGDLLLEDPEISSTHCQIQCLKDGYHVFDLNSTNGTFLNGKRILKCKLQQNDVLRLGQFELKFRNTVGSANAASPVKSAPGQDSKFESPLEKFSAPMFLDDTHAREILTLVRNTKEQLINALGLVLDVTYPDRTSEKIELRERRTIIGRISTIGKFDKDEEISRKHVSISIDQNGNVQASDAGSTNGTFVNDKKILASIQVAPTDVIRVGNTRIRVSLRF